MSNSVLHVAQINERENLQYLHQVAGPLQRVHASYGPAIRISTMAIIIDAQLFYQFPGEFRRNLDIIINRTVIARSRVAFQHEQQQRVKAVSDTIGSEFRFKKKMADKLPRCTICLEEFKSNQKVIQVHTEACCFHKKCLKRHWKYSSRCPNCNVDCA